MVRKHLVFYPTPINFSYLNSFGVIAGVFLIIQFLSGIILALFYVPSAEYAFRSVEHIRRDVTGGWLIRYVHSNGASFFFIAVYLHILRGLYYKSFLPSRRMVWWTGAVIFVLMIATAFLGYVLPWGQMSFWGATVITNLFGAIPFIGSDIVEWLWGGFTVSTVTLNRFFVFHFILPFVLVVVVLRHLYFLHSVGSGNVIGVEEKSRIDYVTFYPYFYVKDLFRVLVVLLCFFFVVCFESNILGHPDNYIIANPRSTPSHIVPEWYFLIFYAVLRIVPQKLGGVLLIGGAIVRLVFRRRRIVKLLELAEGGLGRFRRVQFGVRLVFWVFVVSIVLLTWLGAQVVDSPFIELGWVVVVRYFVILVCVRPLLWVVENESLVERWPQVYERNDVYPYRLFVFNMSIFGEVEENRVGWNDGLRVEFFAPACDLFKVRFILRWHTLRKCKILEYATVVDNPGCKLRFTVFFFLEGNGQAVVVWTQIAEGEILQSCEGLWKNSLVLQREMWDRFGVGFSDSSDGRRLLSDYGFKGHPLRKDFPLTGFKELCYSDEKKKLSEGQVELRQQFRNFYFDREVWDDKRGEHKKVGERRDDWWDIKEEEEYDDEGGLVVEEEYDDEGGLVRRGDELNEVIFAGNNFSDVILVAREEEGEYDDEDDEVVEVEDEISEIVNDDDDVGREMEEEVIIGVVNVLEVP
jgi:quinol-cytochrome oxidoreductase complex cytochrome b subunit/NADH:ubiquinone oxidoreductase subunit C